MIQRKVQGHQCIHKAVFWSKESTLLHYKREGMIEEAKQQIESHNNKIK